ncbi:MAG: ATP-grasp domain-containing protein, partial [Leptothrix sp. (in: b-proteobacteria)]
PLLGTAPAAIDRVRDPAAFFAALALDGIAHPPTQLSAPAPDQAAGWLVKDFAGSGGAQVQPAEAAWSDASADNHADADTPLAFGARSRRHWQQRLVGEPQSLTVIGNGTRAALLGLNRQRLQPGAGCAHRFGGLIGPLAWTAAQAAALQQLADRLVRRFALRGLCSIDLLRVAAADDVADDVAAAEGAEAAFPGIPASLTAGATEATEAPEATDFASPWRVLEVNPRLPASLALYGGTGGLMRAHVAACLRGELPSAAALAALRGTPVQGFDLVYADAPLQLGAAQVARLHAGERAGWWHDVPPLPSRRDAVAIPAGAPLCTLAAAAADADAVATQLAQRRQQLAALLHPEPSRAAGAARAPFERLTQDLTP